LMCVTWRIDMCDVTHWYVWRDTLICVTWRIGMCDVTHWYVWRDALICVTCRIGMCDVPHWYVRRDALICVTWRIDMCDVPHWYVWHDSLTCVTWLIDMCDMIQDSCGEHSAACRYGIHRIIRHIKTLWPTSHVPYTNESFLTYEWVMAQHVDVVLLANWYRMCCSVLQFVAVCCRVLPCVAVRCHVLPCVAVCCKVFRVLQSVAKCCRVLQSVAEFCRVLQSFALTHSVGMSLQMDTILIALPLLWPLHSLDEFCVTWLIHACGSFNCVWFDSSIWWLIQMCVTSLQTVALAWWILCDVTYSHAWLIQMCAAWLIHLCDWFECAWMCSVGVEWLLLVLNVFQNCCGICFTVVEHIPYSHKCGVCVFACVYVFVCAFVCA